MYYAREPLALVFERKGITRQNSPAAGGYFGQYAALFFFFW